MKLNTLIFTMILLLITTSSRAVEVGAPIEVALNAKETMSQTWASVAWSAGSKCWLVVWREGYINSDTSDIWCARVSADGKALNPTGIRLTQTQGVKDRPRVASDGTDFMVVWEDFRNGKDWDVYATRVSGDGVVLDKEPILLVGGEHSQCRPDISFAKNNYHLVWMGFAAGKFDSYGIRFSSDGKVLNEHPVNIFPFKDKPQKGRGRWPAPKGTQGILPVISANANGDLFSACFVSVKHAKRYLAWSAINPETGEPMGPASPVPSLNARKPAPGYQGWYRERAAALALGLDSGMMISCSHTRSKSKKDISVTLFSKTGELLSLEELGSNLTQNNQFKPLRPRPAVTFDGKSYLAISDCLSYIGKKRRPPSYRVKIVGWQIGTDGKVANENGFLIAGDGDLDCMLPAVATGAAGSSLVVYSEMRGVDDVKVLARMLK